MKRIPPSLAALWCLFRFLFLLPVAAGPLPSGEPLRLAPGVPVIVDPSEPGPVLRAVEDLRRDLEWVLGAPSPRLDSLPGELSEPAVVVACNGPATASFRDAALTGPEAHAISVQDNRVVLQGADPRGTIYAIYSFSDRFLDVPPWWVFADWKPARRETVEVPRETRLRWASPQVPLRAWFPNDQDLLTPWIQQDYAMRWNLLAETMLRLKLNMVDIGELSANATRKTEIPRDRGLALTTTHMAPFGASLRNWEKFWAARKTSPAPPLLLSNTAALEEFWEAHIRLVREKKLEMLWMIGFRGDGDKGFHKTFPDAPADDAGRAQVIGEMMRRQVALLKRVTGEAHPLMRTVLYDECSDYLAAGLLQLPEERNLIWNFANARRDHFPAADVRQHRATPLRWTGYYFNAQFTETGCHLADGEGPWKMERNFRLVRQASPNLLFSIINCGNVREFPVTLAAHARMMWDFGAYDSDRFLVEFCRRYWGAASGPEVAGLYRRYFAAYWQQRKPDLPDFPRQYIFQELRLARAARELMKATGSPDEAGSLLGDRGVGYYRIVPEDNGVATRADAVIAGCGQAAASFEAVSAECAALSPRLPEQGRRFFEDSLMRQARFMAAASRCAVASARAAKVVTNPGSYRQWMKEAERAADEMDTALAGPGSDRFALWYASEQIFKLGETKAMISRRVKGMVPKANPGAPSTP